MADCWYSSVVVTPGTVTDWVADKTPTKIIIYWKHISFSLCKERKEVSTSKMMTKADASPFYLPYSIRHPLVLPRHGHITNIIVRHYHERVKHQGRGITMNEILANGFWILGCRSAVDSIIRTCVKCKQLFKFAMYKLFYQRIETILGYERSFQTYSEGYDFHFKINVSAASNMGGVNERQVLSIRNKSVETRIDSVTVDKDGLVRKAKLSMARNLNARVSST
ncbi:hypothetical protein MAR_034264 [Mya arenaria]|uniref:Integrase zinc-binding domain-containing protein n=1 Tax=Mya arenaria TaxID=6604 RepID=A0ABY7GEE9_MYAAR|nr:hypothetical protein MAR_034264 [Mya arenaria]